MLQGTIIRMEGGAIGVECHSAYLDEPRTNRFVWRLATWRITGMTWRNEDSAIGRPASIRDGQISCYLGDGCYLQSTLVQGGATPCALSEVLDIPRPKVRKGIETRYRDGRWQKYSKRQGWIAA